MPRDNYFGAPAHLRQMRCDRVQAGFRAEQTQSGLVRREPDAQPQRRSIRRDPPPSAAPLAPTEDQVLLRVAEELDYARRLLDIMGDELINDPAVIARHGTALQSVDIIGQMLGHLSNVVKASDGKAAVERIGMAELKGRLSRRAL